MPRLQPTLSLSLGLVAAAGLLYAWQLHGQLGESDAARQTLAAETTRLRDRIAALEKKSTAPATLSRRAFPLAADAPADLPRTGDTGGPRGPEREARFAALRDSPEIQGLMAIQRRAALDGRYAALFRKLNLNPADLERFKTLLADKQATAGDVLAAARAQGLNPRDNRDQIAQLVAKYESESDAVIQSALGETQFQAYKQYEQTMPERGVVGQLEQRLSYSPSPLVSDQTEQLVNLLAAANPARPVTAGPNAAATLFGNFNGAGRVQVTDNVVAQSQGFLSAPQLDALRQIQQEQAAQDQLRQQMRARMNPGATTATPATGGPQGP